MKKIIIIFAVILTVSVAFATPHTYTPTATSATRSTNYTVHIDEYPLTAGWTESGATLDVVAGEVKPVADYSIFTLTGGDGRNAKCTMSKTAAWPRLKLHGEWQDNLGTPLPVTVVTPDESWITHFTFPSTGIFEFQFFANEIDQSPFSSFDSAITAGGDPRPEHRFPDQ